MNLNRKFIFLILVTSKIAFCDAVSGNLFFYDECTRKPTVVRTDAGLFFNLILRNLDPTLPVSVNVELSPARKTTGQRSVRIKITDQPVERDGSFFFQHSVQLPVEDDVISKKLSRIWVATARWNQENFGDLNGVAQNNIYLARPEETQFYQIVKVSPEDNICRWESAPKVISNYEYNRFTAVKTVSLELPYIAFSPDRGIDIGAKAISNWNPEFGPLYPGLEKDRASWLFPSWSEAFSEESRKMTKSESIPQGQGGVFVQHLLHTRFWAQQYFLSPSNARRGNKCSTWHKGNQGWLDVSVSKEDFVYLSEEKFSSQDSLGAINEIRPPVDTCQDVSTKSDWLIREDEKRLIPGSSDQYPMHFYPGNTLEDKELRQLQKSLITFLHRNALEKGTKFAEDSIKQRLLGQVDSINTLGERFSSPTVASGSLLNHPRFNPNATDERGLSLLMVAIEAGDERLINDLLGRENTDVNLRVNPSDQDKRLLKGYSTLGIGWIFSNNLENDASVIRLLSDPRLDINAPLTDFKVQKGNILRQAIWSGNFRVATKLASRKDLRLTLGIGDPHPPAIFAFSSWKAAGFQFSNREQVFNVVANISGAANQNDPQGYSLAGYIAKSFAEELGQILKFGCYESKERKSLDQIASQAKCDYRNGPLKVISKALVQVAKDPNFALNLDGKSRSPRDIFLSAFSPYVESFNRLENESREDVLSIVRGTLGKEGTKAFFMLVGSYLNVVPTGTVIP